MKVDWELSSMENLDWKLCCKDQFLIRLEENHVGIICGIFKLIRIIILNSKFGVMKIKIVGIFADISNV